MPAPKKDSAAREGSGLEKAEKVAKAVVDKLFEKLSGASAAPGDPPRLFFPNGIELIHVTVETAFVTVELRVAGAKGVSAEAEEDQ